MTQQCPTCGRQIIVERGRFTVHSDGRYHKGGARYDPKLRPLPSCPMSNGTPATPGSRYKGEG